MKYTLLLILLFISLPALARDLKTGTSTDAAEIKAEIISVMEGIEKGNFIYPDNIESYAMGGSFIKDSKGNEYQTGELNIQGWTIADNYGKEAVPVLLKWLNHKEKYIRHICDTALRKITGVTPSPLKNHHIKDAGEIIRENNKWQKDKIKAWQEWYDINKGNDGWTPISQLNGSEAEAWEMFSTAVNSLQEKGDRKAAAKLFKKISRKFPDSDYSGDSKELKILLEEMAKEDAAWKEPDDIDKLTLKEKIAYNIYHLRDLNFYQSSQPGMNILDSSAQTENTYNAAVELKNIGRPAIPYLIKLLDDCRPTRSTGYLKDSYPSRTILRYQDAAAQILNELSATFLYRNGSTVAYFSDESPEARTEIIDTINSWYRDIGCKSEADQKWMSLEDAPDFWTTLIILDSIAADHGQKKQVLFKLKEMIKDSNPVRHPQISFLMCQLGDRSELDKVASLYLSGKFNRKDYYESWSSARDYTLWQMILYGSKKHHEELKKIIFLEGDRSSESMRDNLFNVFDSGSYYYCKLPEGYDKKNIPVHLLTAALDLKEKHHDITAGKEKWTLRFCDSAALAIQELTEMDFGYDGCGDVPIEQKDLAIAKIKAWWKKEGVKRFK